VQLPRLPARLGRADRGRVHAAGSAAIERRHETLHPLEELIGEDFDHGTGAPALAAEAITGAIFTLIQKRLRSKGAASLPALAPLLTYITLCPFLGAEEACRVANGDGRGRSSDGTSRTKNLDLPL
jgi:hypothetical protein